MVLYSCNPRAREVEAGGSGSQAHSNLEISVGYIKPYLKKQNSPAWCYILLNPALRRQGQLAYLCEFEAKLDLHGKF